MTKVLSIVLGGGKGTRLFPLTKSRSKPAVPFGGKYRIVDIPISNCLNSGFNQVYILTQFNSASLHLHIARTYNFDNFSGGFVEILAAEQRIDQSGWYEGTADAVRKNLQHFRPQRPTHYLIVSGDQLYRMDLDDMFKKHIESGCGLTIAGTTVGRAEADDLGIMSMDAKSRVTRFLEKPGPTKNIDDFKIPKEFLSKVVDPSREYLANMGIYIFNAELMEDALAGSEIDFGKEVIPSILAKSPINAYLFEGYWEDIGTLRSFYEANLNLCSIAPKFNFYDESRPIFTRMRNLPSSKISFCTLNQVITADGCMITNSSISNSIIGLRMVVEAGCTLDGVVCMGSDHYETDQQKAENRQKGLPNLGIGRNCVIKGAIIDTDSRIGDNCRIGIDPKERKDGDYGFYYIVDGVIVVPKGVVVPSGTVI